VEGIEGDLDGEPQEDAQEYGLRPPAPERGELGRKGPVRAHPGERLKIQRAGGGEDGREAEQQERASADRVDHELIGGARGRGPAPQPDEKVRGDEAELQKMNQWKKSSARKTPTAAPCRRR
jgi:hypothetical protein